MIESVELLTLNQMLAWERITSDRKGSPTYPRQR
jgi:hypothetical protein